MRRLLLSYLFCFTCVIAFSQKRTLQWPDSIYTGKQGNFHIQGFTLDSANGFIYASFTNKLLKLNLRGEVLGSVIGIVGHLGDLEFNANDGKIYASLEYKNDAIGKGINVSLGLEHTVSTSFYIAVIDATQITKQDMHVDSVDILTGIYLHDVVQDYEAEMEVGNKKIKHRYGCSGIDGITFAPALGGKDSKSKYLYLAYGIYGDTTRIDNDYQVLLKFDVSEINSYARPMNQYNLHQSGPNSALEKYFVKTGNTRYGIQNLSYDSHSGNLYAAVYKGAKSSYSNFDLFVISGHKKPLKMDYVIDGVKKQVSTITLVKSGTKDKSGEIYGWYFKWGATGIQSLGNGLFYISQQGKAEDGQQYSNIVKYKWVGDSKTAFVKFENK